MKAPEEIADNALVLMADIFPTGEWQKIKSMNKKLMNMKAILRPITLSKK